MKKLFLLPLALTFCLSACGDDSSSSASGSDVEEISSAVEGESSSSAEEEISSSAKKGESSSSVKDKAASSSSAKSEASAKSSSSAKKASDEKSSDEKSSSSKKSAASDSSVKSDDPEESSSSAKSSSSVASSSSKKECSLNTDCAIYDAEANTVTDYRYDEADVYRLVKFGDQIWTADNVVNYYPWADAIDVEGEYSKPIENCDKSTYCHLTGKVRGQCPVGFHMPSVEEWKEMLGSVATSVEEDSDPTDYNDCLEFVKENASEYTVAACDTTYIYKTVVKSWKYNGAGAKLKSKEDWVSGAGTDDFGFSVMPLGMISDNSQKVYVGETACFWTTTEINGNDDHAGIVRFSAENDYAEISEMAKYIGCAVRCVMD